MTVELHDEVAFGGKGRWAWIRDIPLTRRCSIEASKWAEYWCDLNGFKSDFYMAGADENKIGWAHIQITPSSFDYAE